MEGNTVQISLFAMLDTSSPISLIRAKFVPPGCYCPIPSTSTNDYGVNGSKLNILGVIEQIILVQDCYVNVSFYVVPDDTMHGLQF